MSELSSNNSVAPWLESALSRQLGPVHAPPLLWNQIQSLTKPRRRLHLPIWVVAGVSVLVTVSVLLAGWRVNTVHASVSDLEMLAIANTTNPLDFTSDNPVDIRRWVKVRTGIDIELVDRSPSVRLLGARVIQLRGASMAAIAYRTADDSGTLLVSKNCDALQRKPEQSHLLLKATHGKQVFSWNARNQIYTIASSNPKNIHGACALCHADSRGI